MRVLVDPPRERHGDPVGCVGVTMEDGRTFRANRKGHIDVPDAHTAHQMVANPLAPGMVAIWTGGVPRTKGVSCGHCGFNGFPFHKSAPCPRCGAEAWETNTGAEGGSE